MKQQTLQFFTKSNTQTQSNEFHIAVSMMKLAGCGYSTKQIEKLVKKGDLPLKERLWNSLKESHQLSPLELETGDHQLRESEIIRIKHQYHLQ